MRVSKILLVWYPPTPLSHPLGVVAASARTICRGLEPLEAGKGGAGKSILRLFRPVVLVVKGLLVASAWKNKNTSKWRYLCSRVYLFLSFFKALFNGFWVRKSRPYHTKVRKIVGKPFLCKTWENGLFFLLLLSPEANAISIQSEKAATSFLVYSIWSMDGILSG